MSTTTTPLMNLVLPVVGTQTGPAWANNINAAFDLVDAHDHTTGKGSQIPTSALNINEDLSLNESGLTAINYSQFKDNVSPLSAATYPRALDVSSGELYYNDGAGNAIQLTSGGGINLSSIGTIGGDYSTSTASVAYSSLSSTFTFTSSSGVYAKVNLGDLKIFERVSGGNYVQLKTQTGLGSSYDLKLPTLPASNLPMKLDSTGNITTGLIQSSELGSLAITESQLSNLSVSTAKLQNDAVTTAKIENANVTYEKLEDTNIVASGTFSTAAITSQQTVSGSSISFTVNGRGISGRGTFMLQLSPSVDSDSAYVYVDAGSGSTASGYVDFMEDSTVIARYPIGLSPFSLGIATIPVSAFSRIYYNTAGARTYTIRAESTGTGVIRFYNCSLLIVEL